MSSPTAVLAHYTTAASLDGVPAPVVHKVKELILDHLGCALGGSRTPLARAAADVAGNGGGATVAGTRIKTAPDRMARGVGTEFDVLRVSLKPYPCCRWLHSTVDAVRQAMAEHRVDPREVRRVTVRSMAPLVDWFQNRRPATMVDAEFSVPHAVAMTLLGRPRSDWWLEANRTDPDVLALMDRVTVELDEAAQAEYAQHRNSAWIPATVVVDTARGTFERSRKLCHGGPDDPMTWGEIEGKFRELAEPVIGGRRAAAVLQMVTELEAVGSLDELTAALAGA